MRTTSNLAAIAASLAILSTNAMAHTGATVTSGLQHGFMHPIGGLDHVLAMVAVGLLAALLGGRSLALVPLAFVSMMAAGGVLGMAGVPLPMVEAGIAGSIVAIGAAVALGLNLPAAGAMALVGFFAVFHGYAHSAEMPADSSGLAYGAGFLAATALLHAAGIGLGLSLGAGRTGRLALRMTGGAVTLAGAAVMGGLL